jgi:hypothetical protein
VEKEMVFKSHSDILPKEENGKQLSKNGTFQGFDVIFRRKGRCM